MKIYRIIRLCLLASLAILVGIFAYQLADYLKYLVGSLMLLYGLEAILVPLISFRKKCIENPNLFFGIIDLILGLLILTAIDEYQTICVIWACWTIVREAFEFYEIFESFRKHRFPMVISFIESVVEIVFSIILILNPHKDHALIHIYLLVAELIVSGFSLVALEIFLRRKSQKLN